LPSFLFRLFALYQPSQYRRQPNAISMEDKQLFLLSGEYADVSSLPKTGKGTLNYAGHLSQMPATA
jgi:hypothetical protein